MTLNTPVCTLEADPATLPSDTELVGELEEWVSDLELVNVDEGFLSKFDSFVMKSFNMRRQRQREFFSISLLNTFSIQ